MTALEISRLNTHTEAALTYYPESEGGAKIGRRASGSARAAHPCRNFLTSMRAAGESAYIINRKLVIKKLVIDGNWES